VRGGNGADVPGGPKAGSRKGRAAAIVRTNANASPDGQSNLTFG